MCRKSAYRLCNGVQVRPESFGLLFYRYDGPKLYFVPSGNLVDESFFCGEQALGDLIDVIRVSRGWPEAVVERHILAVLNLLKSRGLVYEQSVR